MSFASFRECMNIIEHPKQVWVRFMHNHPWWQDYGTDFYSVETKPRRRSWLPIYLYFTMLTQSWNQYSRFHQGFGRCFFSIHGFDDVWRECLHQDVFRNQVGCRYVWRSSTEKVGSSTFDSSAFGDFDAWATERSSDVRYYIFWGIVISVFKYHTAFPLVVHLSCRAKWQSGVDNLTSFGFPCYKVRKYLSFKVGFFNFLLAPQKFMNFTSPEWFDGCLVDEISWGISGHEGFQCENTPWNKQFVPETNGHLPTINFQV